MSHLESQAPFSYATLVLLFSSITVLPLFAQ